MCLNIEEIFQILHIIFIYYFGADYFIELIFYFSQFTKQIIETNDVINFGISNREKARLKYLYMH